jgi:Replication-relaxation
MTGNSQGGIVIQTRDEHLLREIALVLRFVDREQAKIIAGFTSTTRANTRLLMLYRAGLLRRFFHGTVAGGRKALYACSEKGAQLVGAPYQRVRYRNDELVTTNVFLLHQSWVNWVYCWSKYTVSTRPGVSFLRWVNFSEPIAASLTPDGYLEFSALEKRLGCFVEVDLGNEGIGVWKDKVRKYKQYAASGNFEKRFHVEQFRALVITNDEKRTQRLRHIVRELTEKIFWFSTISLIQTGGFWAPFWQRAAGDEYRSLA